MGERGSGERRGRGEEERGKRHRDLIAVQLSAKASGREQCSLRHSQSGRAGVGKRAREGRRERDGEGRERERAYISGVFLKHNWPSLSFDL